MSQETANFMRLARLLVDKGTEALRKEFDAIHPPANLPAVLAAWKKSLLRLKFGVINKSQWELLYPPSGKPPDSKTFDISLLTVLFRKICGLPSKGWDAVPLDTDRSLQANIIRIKTWRNDYAHAKATRMDDATFESLWVKICQALLELKIPQKDIDDLKTSPLSPEINYVEVSKNFQEKLEDLSTDVKDTKDDVTDMKDDVKGTKDDVKDMKDDVEDMKRDVKDMKDDVKGTKDDVKDMKDDVEDMKDDVEDMKRDVKDMKDDVKGTKDDVKDMKDDVKDIKDDVKSTKDDVNDMKDRVKDMKDVKDIKQIKKRLGLQQRSQISTTHPLKGVDDTDIEINRYKDEDLLQKLAKHNFAGKIKGKMKYFFPGTREWLLKRVEDWFNENEQESKLLLLKAGPGFGKSVFAAKMCEIFREKGKLAACFFCDFRDANLRNPTAMLQSLASQMCKNVDGFKEKLLDQLKRPHKIYTMKEAFRIYLQNPLDELEVAEPSLIVIDGLDESEANDRSDIVSLISECFSELPDCIKFLITSRPEISIAKLNDIPNINIENDDEKNDSDIEIYLKFCLPKLLEREEDSYSVVFKRLVKMCEGSFLYAYHCQYELGKRDDLANVTSNEIVKFLPKGIGSVYEKYFKRLEKELKELQHCRLDVLKFLEILVAAQRSLPLTFVAKALGLAPDCRETRRIIAQVNEVISCLLYVADDMVTVFHKTVIDWLLARGYEGHDYVVNISDGNKSLWLVCEQTFEEIKRRPLSEYKRELTPGENYALYFGSDHLLNRCDMLDSFSWFVDVAIVCAIMHHIEDCYITLFDTWNKFLSKIDKLRGGTVQINNKLRARLRWHRAIFEEELQYEWKTFVSYSCPPELLYLERILARPSNDYFNDEEKTFARSVLSLYVPLFVENDVDVLPLEEWHVETEITAVSLSKDKTTAAVAMKDGTISLVSVPTLFEEWQYETGYKGISSVTFAPDDSFLLFGKLETVLDIAQKKELAFFAEYSETFISCAFSPNGLRLITSHGCDPMKIWDVARKRLISELETGVFVNWCTFDITGLFIVAFDKINYFEFCRRSDYDFRFRIDPVKYVVEDSFSIWNAFTLQRCDERILPEIKKGNALRSGKCKRCFWPGIAKQPTYGVCRCPEKCKLFLCVLPFGHNYHLSTGIYNGVECYIALEDDSLNVVETTHFTTLAAWDCFTFTFDRDNMFSGYEELAAIDNDHWLYSNESKLLVLRTPVAIPPVVIVYWSSFSPDSSRLATCSSDGYIKIWNVDKRQVEQRFKVDQGETPFVCWLSKEFLFVFNSIDGMPCLWKFPVWRNSKILFTKGEQHSLTYLRNEFVSASQVVEFSGGLLFLKFGETAPVKVLDVNRDGEPQITTLPVVNILVSPDGVFVLSIGKKTLNIWKRNSTNALQFDFFLSYERVSKPQSYYTRFNTLFRFSNDSKVVVFSESKPFRLSTGDFKPPYVRETVILDLVTRSLKRVLLSDDSSYLNWFCLNKNRVIIATSLHRIHVFDMDSGAQIWSPAGQNFLKRFAEMKLSPDETVLALPKLNGDMKFIRLSIAHNALLEEIKKNAAINWQNEITGTK
ncbi:uncharacterized protein LOC114532937 [Dendronephthya gigantea]|uniref:uncharacterized protein LOC114532937 n=1 Tax=Dendronephthya gigantea TaxID=151771 RepID=UPI00106D98FC|nr:uncharacterized protein LOC114532937 [Dendronephthya gigantea]